MNDLIQPFIMCGGSGTRLWPVSRASMPKQFQAFVGDRTLLQETAMRVTGPGFAPPAFVAAESYRYVIADQIKALAIRGGPMVLEPVPRNTAAVALVASLLAERNGGGPVLLLPSDHVIKDAAAFRDLVQAALPAAEAGHICLFGIAPNRPETGYGYIEIGPEGVPDPDSPVRRVARFVEKPDLAGAERMLGEDRFVWNSGIFLFAPATMIQEAEERRPDLLALARAALDGAKVEGDVIPLDPEAFGRMEAISVDYAFMEGSARTAVSRAAIDWSDLGAWDAIHDAHRPDVDGNVILGRAVGFDTRNSFLRSERQLIATVGLSDLLVIATDDAILIADRSKAQDVKHAVEALRDKGFGEALAHAEVHRPWGSYRSVVAGDRFQVKVITVKPGGQLSLQLHRHRAEHWVVVRGSAEITCGDKVFMLYENQSTFIPQGETHRLRNPGHIPLEMIEVQSGSYLGEDDIVRVEDVYGRS
ncbi:mannose-1-phosphate guanylyltransferase/mannose-6-phosphate isomerase [Enterovirga sp.]|uniref:mannose-1-phosphate guanylyltransferase/mannose-6-phosphate isomerase n=1 Tax=Enterovirga sp. TaxID=2026350 RepID=UPI00261D3A30|nr:mannose-1-phosphate guanylyltransferase/mannose-6-phosphate isomerase [Enterovirga sp.]